MHSDKSTYMYKSLPYVYNHICGLEHQFSNELGYEYNPSIFHNHVDNTRNRQIKAREEQNKKSREKRLFQSVE